ncbi:MAG: 30S ribosomal protein S11 [Candidatus Spechtbacteria bacterium]|uniref:Small ribosomal subunit protein uS11 n=1 Tax=Candidatus Spechtbacteria bacterium RIFCSPLOWO2_01_FULL_43_12 TaxID=1802162 RepID=A0A1G2HEG2_9BACT|nr:30S ribosomal protein S11 [Candidatus Spechtbacteria bacterium]OGZ60865.1 MAG: 30S ribosomal protein S11 [Candidatus Spechtbacteria bacterium RIFCSPLOWO2_01_FULL_43_12]
MGKKRVALVEGEESPQKQEAKEEKKKKRVLERANIYVQASYNNTQITVSDENGAVVVWTTAGAAGFKGPRKATPYAASKVVDIIFEKLEPMEIKEAHVFAKGIGSGRDSALRALTSRNLNILSINDITPVPHNGCRIKKRRRV